MKRINIIIFGLLIPFFICSSFPTAAQYDSEVYQAQKALKARGYNPGTPDGVWGKATERAVKYFQVDNELPVTGKLDGQTKTKLGLTSSNKSVKSKSPTGEQRVALVIGNSAYQYAPLRNPQNDAVDMASSLNNLGFKVTKRLNASRREIEEAINSFGRELRKGGVGLFYFAGHGVQVNGINYLIPIGTNIESEGDVRYEAVNANRVLSKMQDAGNPLNLVFLDACRNNPFARQFRSTEQGLAPMDAPKGSFVAYATAPGDVAAEGDNRNGIFTKHLLRYMREPGLEVGLMMRKVRTGVQNDTSGKQTPFEVSSLTGDFYFASVGTPEPQPPILLSNERVKLDRERQKLELLRLEIVRKELEDERERLEEEQKKSTIVASIDPKDLEIARDGHYIAYASGVVLDTTTGLEWVAGPDRDTDWAAAKAWVDGLNAAGGGWRMPTIDELQGLYQSEKAARNMTPLLKTTGWYVWSGEAVDSPRARNFHFDSGGMRWYSRYDSYNYRAFAVRSRSSTESKLQKEEAPKYASISPKVSEREVIKRDGQFIVHADGTVLDTKTGLMWASKDNGRDVTWKEAKEYCENYRGGGYADWRMPFQYELAGIYDKKKKNRHGYQITKLIKISGCCPWASETRVSKVAGFLPWQKKRYSEAANFYFNKGLEGWNEQSFFLDARALPVRSGN